jgi:CheY-like chemotaxis protein
MVADEISLNHALENVNPDVVVADLSLPISTKTNIARTLKKNFPKIRVIILSIHDEKSVVDDVMTAGVEGFVKALVRSGPFFLPLLQYVFMLLKRNEITLRLSDPDIWRSPSGKSGNGYFFYSF